MRIINRINNNNNNNNNYNNNNNNNNNNNKMIPKNFMKYVNYLRIILSV